MPSPRKRLYILDKDCVYKTSREQWREYLQARASGRRNSYATTQYSSAASTAIPRTSTLAPSNSNSRPNISWENLLDADPPTGASVEGQQHVTKVRRKTSARVWRISAAAVHA
jgi:hypothetical protein